MVRFPETEAFIQHFPPRGVLQADPTPFRYAPCAILEHPDVGFPTSGWSGSDLGAPRCLIFSGWSGSDFWGTPSQKFFGRGGPGAILGHPDVEFPTSGWSGSDLGAPRRRISYVGVVEERFLGLETTGLGVLVAQCGGKGPDVWT